MRRSIEQALARLSANVPDVGGASVGGSGTVGKVPVWTGPATLGDSDIDVPNLAYLSDLFTQVMADARYSLLGHTHSASEITDFDAAITAFGDARYFKLTDTHLDGPLDIGDVTGIAAAMLRVGGDIRASGEMDADDFVLVGGSSGGGSASALFSVSDEGVLKASAVSSINFTGGGVVASAVGDVVTVAITFDQAAADARYSLLGHTHSSAEITDFAGAVGTVGNALWLALTGGELTGPLLGTTADFSGEVDGADFVLVGGSSGGGASAALFSVLDEGVLKSSAVSSINFTGAGVTASAVGDAVTVAITFDQGAADARYVQLANFNTLGDARYSLLGHTHPYLPLAGGTMTGAVTMSGSGGAFFVNDRTTPTHQFAFYATGDQGILWTGNGIDAFTIDFSSGRAAARRGMHVYGDFNIFSSDGNSNVFEAKIGGARAYTGLTVDIGLVSRRINMDRSGGAAGLSFYASTFSAWQMYMSDASSGQGYLGNLTAPAGSFVTSWALRSVVEPAAGYGWTWESVAATGTTPGIAMELSSQTGNLRASGVIYSSSAFGWMLGNAAGYNRIYYAPANGRFEFVNAADQFTQIISKTARVSDYFLSDVSHGSGMVGLYEPSHYRLIYAMGIPYNMPLDGTTLGTLYGMFFAFDNPSYKDITGRTLGHGFGLAENGVQKFFCGAQGMWHSGDATAHDFILS